MPKKKYYPGYQHGGKVRTDPLRRPDIDSLRKQLFAQMGPKAVDSPEEHGMRRLLRRLRGAGSRVRDIARDLPRGLYDSADDLSHLITDPARKLGRKLREGLGSLRRPKDDLEYFYELHEGIDEPNYLRDSLDWGEPEVAPEPYYPPLPPMPGPDSIPGPDFPEEEYRDEIQNIMKVSSGGLIGLQGGGQVPLTAAEMYRIWQENLDEIREEIAQNADAYSGRGSMEPYDFPHGRDADRAIANDYFLENLQLEEETAERMVNKYRNLAEGTIAPGQRSALEARRYDDALQDVRARIEDLGERHAELSMEPYDFPHGRDADRAIAYEGRVENLHDQERELKKLRDRARAEAGESAAGRRGRIQGVLDEDVLPWDVQEGSGRRRTPRRERIQNVLTGGTGSHGVRWGQAPKGHHRSRKIFEHARNLMRGAGKLGKKGLGALALSGPLGDLFELGATPVPTHDPNDPHMKSRRAEAERRERERKARIDAFLFDPERMTARQRLEGRASGGLIGLANGGAAPGGTAVTQSHVNPAVSQQYANLTDRIVQEGQRAYQPYNQQRIAGFTTPEAMAQQAAINYGMGMGPQGTIQAGQTLGQAGQMIQGAQQGLAGLQPQYAQMAGQFGQAAQGALGQAQAGAQGMRDLAGRAELQGQLAGAGMRQTGAAAQAQQQALGAGQAAQGLRAQQEQQQLGAQQEARGRIAQTQMQGLGQQAQQAGQGALGVQQGYAAGMAGLGAQAGAQGQAGQAAFGALGTAAGQLGQTAMGQMGQVGQAAQQAGQIGAADIRQAGIEGQQLGQQALGQMGQVGQQSQQQAAQAAQRMRDIGGQAPQLQKGADLSDYMSQYSQAALDPQYQAIRQAAQEQMSELGSKAAMSGAGGGYRHGLGEQAIRQQQMQQVGDVAAKGAEQAFQHAQQAFQADRAAQQQAQQTGLSAEQQAAQTQAGAQGQALAAQQAGFGAAQQGQAGRQAAAQSATQAQQQGLAAQLQAQQAGVGAAQTAGAQQLTAAQQGQAAGQAGTAAQMQAQQQAAGMADVGAGRQMQGLAAQGALTAQGIGMGAQGLAAQQQAALAGAG